MAKVEVSRQKIDDENNLSWEVVAVDEEELSVIEASFLDLPEPVAII